ncbi:MAG: hypothetical protein HKP48_08650 [Winogradskyella sp.]|uniref:hypothetical protein n=1 Tax=Winogradskyella sp. TaxID=1883156 RepID=UPI0017C8F754|nr:hypothetical protein [Winogradskyella sp.]MBT8245772.1 hypothetical protein [Winogradskyella sp.]NNK23342.1 hypothetical protein [Winogradskyella sp.]
MKKIELKGLTESKYLVDLLPIELREINGGVKPPWWYSPALVIYDAFESGWNFGSWLADQTCSHESCNS